jgi:hypothetical protein
MWIMTDGGFISVVQKKKSDEFLTVRARDPQSLRAVCRVLELDPAKEIIKSSNTDYGYRVFLTRGQVTRYLSSCVAGLDYSNFKDRVTKTRGEVWHEALMDVWVAMLSVAPNSRRSRRSSGSRRRRQGSGSYWLPSEREAPDTLEQEEEWAAAGYTVS